MLRATLIQGGLLKCLELIAGLPHIPSRLAVRKIELKLDFSLVTEQVPKDAAVIGNFKPRLLKPDEEFWISLPRAQGGLEQVAITGRQCCEAFFREIGKLLKAQGRKPEQDTTLRLSEPPFASASERRTFQETVRKAAKEAGLGAVVFFREPDAIFEYFRLLHRAVPAQGQKALNFLVLDFGGGTCNVSVVSTTRQGGLWQRYIAAPVAAEAPSAGGLYIDQELLTQALVAAGIKHHTSRNIEERKAYEAWLERHMAEAEHIKRQVSETGLAHQLPVRLDGRLAEFSGGERTLDIRLDPERLRGIVQKHWDDRGIRKAVDAVLLKLHQKLTRTAQRKEVPDDPRALVTQVLLAGGSSQLPGFVDHVKKYFEPHSPKFTQVGQDYAYSVAVGMGLNLLAMDHALLDERVPVPLQPAEAKAAQGSKAPEEPVKATDSTFMAAFPDDLCLFWVPPKGLEPQLLFPEDTSPFDLLEMPQVKNLELPGRSGAGFRQNKFQTQSLGYQIAYRSDEEAREGLSSRRLNVGQHQIQVPADLKRGLTLRTSMRGQPGRFLELALEVVDPTAHKTLDAQSIPFLTEAPPAQVKAPPPGASSPKARPAEASEPVGRLLALKRDALCIDFGTTNTTLIDLNNDSEITIGQFLNSVRPISLVSTATPLPTARAVPLVTEATTVAAAQSRAAPAAPPLADVAQRASSTGGKPSLEALIPKDEVGSSSTQQLAENLRGVMRTLPEEPPETLRPRARVQRKLPARNGKPFEGTEMDFIQHIDGICRAARFDFPRELLETLFLSLKVRPFVVLAGPSGVGKSALAQLMAEASGGAVDSQDLLRVAVEAHWTDSRFIFGRRDAQGFRPTDFYRLLESAQPDRLYHVLLDEMNLAHVEYYFAQLLSAMESDGLLRVPEDDEGSPSLRIPSAGPQLPLLRLYGTINVDESTQVLSDKVIDRVNVIEVEAQPPKEFISAEVQRQRRVPEYHLSVEQLRQWHQLPEKELKVPKVIQEIWAVMAQREPHAVAPASSGPLGGLRGRQPIPIGHRIVRDIALFVHYAERLGGSLTSQDAIDLQIKQRILPKIRGDLRLQEMLDDLAKVLTTHQLTRSAKRLESMRHQLEIDQFVTFWT